MSGEIPIETCADYFNESAGSETVSSGRAPASSNALVAYTPSRTVISPRGVWYVNVCLQPNDDLVDEASP